MARRRRVSSRNEAGTVSFFASGKGITVAKRKKITFTARGSDPKTPVRKVSFYSPSLKVLRKRALLKREIVKEVEKLINKKIDGGKIDLFEFEGETNKMIRTTARLAIEMWEKRR